MRKLAIILAIIAGTINGYAQVPVQYADSLQSIIELYQGTSSIPGISAAVFIKDVGIWQGTTGESHPGVALDTSMLLGIGSNTKLFTSVLCLKLAEQNILTLDDSIYQWLPNYNYVDSNITIRQLLQHQSGVDDYTESSSFPDTVLNYPDLVWEPEAILNLIGPPDFQAGTSVAYSNTNYILAGMLLESATGISYHTLVRDSILTPLNLNNTFLEGFEPVTGTPAHPWLMGEDLYQLPRTSIGTISWAAGCIVSKPSDMVIWYDALFNQDFLTQQSLNEMTNFINWPGLPYNMGLGLFEVYYSSKMYWGHGGGTIGHSSFFLYDTACNHSVAVIMNDTDADPEPISKVLIKTICELTSATIGINEISNKKVVIYPNPGSDHIFIRGDIDNLISITVYDIHGRTVSKLHDVTEKPVKINTSGFPDGIYSVVLNTKESILSKKILIYHNK